MSVVIHKPAGSASESPLVLSRPVVVRVAGVRLELERVCASCTGAGYVPVVYEECCRSCDGGGFADVDTEIACEVLEGRSVVHAEVMEECGVCDGSGIELTTQGRRLLIEAGADLFRFLRRWRRA